MENRERENESAKKELQNATVRKRFKLLVEGENEATVAIAASESKNTIKTGNR